MRRSRRGFNGIRVLFLNNPERRRRRRFTAVECLFSITPTEEEEEDIQLLSSACSQ